MEHMSKVCKSLQRGSADLFQTMVQCYEESFDIKLEDEGENELNGNRKSVKKTEILLNRDLVLKELADTEKNYVESLEYIVQVRVFLHWLLNWITFQTLFSVHRFISHR